MRYFFHARRNGALYEDDEGTSFPSADEAKAHGEIVAAELAGSGGWRGVSLDVVDEEGREIGRVQVTQRDAALRARLANAGGGAGRGRRGSPDR